jgi:hypothetical protein
VATLIVTSPTVAVPTATFKISTFEQLNKGEPQGTFISSEGEVVAGRSATRLKFSPGAMVFSTTSDNRGTIFFGTGDQGHLLAVREGKVRKVADLKSILVTSLALGPKGKILAGTMPGARVLLVDGRTGKWQELAKLPAEHVWALAYDSRAGRIYAASGSPGKIFSIPESGGTPEVLFDPEEKHLLCLARQKDGSLLTGSSDKAILYRVTGKDLGTAVHDFDANELRDVVVAPDGSLYVAVNKFTRKTSGLPRFDSTKEGEEGTAIKVDKDKKKEPSKVRAQELRPGAKTGKGALYRLGPRGSIDQLLSLEKSYFTDLALDADGLLWAGDGTKGKVYIVRDKRTVLTAFDVDERQVLALGVSGRSHYLGTGDAGAIYRVSAATGPRPAYLSEVFDASFPAHWGNMHMMASGPLTLASRTGNTSKPDKTWSKWRETKPLTSGLLRLASPSGRYLQARMTWPPSRAGVLRSFSVYYRPKNQRARVSEITFGDGEKSDKDKPKPKTPKIKIKWKVDNPDKDQLVYRLFYREEMGLTWRSLGNANEPLKKTEFEWDTEPVADGFYRVKVEASDEQANAPRETLTDSRISPRLLVANRKPELASLITRYPWVSGMARDSYSPIKRIEYSLDGKPWRLVGPLDGIYDSPSESFRFRLPDKLKQGSHVLAVRAIDAAGNMGVDQVYVVR